ncbi:nucleotidyltransferase [Dyadobacter sp. CY347]|uniref:nucleotidyltransferase domain-containing protein n=1 Tax=Dyadobacter sp. CY347 TaxID=2909336 RepID=UPI001F29C3C6|nr:nucleotidyltransferase [Dyadobacter sp. CY347]MCF2491135.1 nucleotidyltransferase [Dyadobacter sp. CY347]
MEDRSAPYDGREYSIYLQGSYGNDTNIYADSDVDVVIQLDSVYYSDLEGLSQDDLNLYNASRSTASYSYGDFKTDVIGQLRLEFGSLVKPGNKAILVEGNGTRRDSDVLAATLHRRYTRFKSYSDQSYHEGIRFLSSSGTEIINFPKQHSANCTTKNKATNGWFKPSVRILKNMRNSMITKGYLQEGIAPSYFLEGMLYNVPNSKFGSTFQDTVVNSINWLNNSDKNSLLCANELYRLLHPTSPVTWRAESFDKYLSAVNKFWNAQ